MRASRSGKMPTTSVRRRISRLRRSLGLKLGDLAPDLLGEGGEGQHVGAGGLEVLGDLRQFVGQGVQDPVELGVHGGGVGLVVDRVQQRSHPGPGRLRADRHEVRGVAAEGLDGLGDRPGAGRKPRIGQAQRSQLIALVASPPPGRLVRYDTGELTATDATGPAGWTLDALTAAARAAGLDIARSQVRRSPADGDAGTPAHQQRGSTPAVTTGTAYMAMLEVEKRSRARTSSSPPRRARMGSTARGM